MSETLWTTNLCHPILNLWTQNTEETSFFRKMPEKNPTRWSEKVPLGPILKFSIFSSRSEQTFSGTTGNRKKTSASEIGWTLFPIRKRCSFVPNSSTRNKNLLSWTLVATSCARSFGRTTCAVSRILHFVKNWFFDLQKSSLVSFRRVEPSLPSSPNF